MATWQEFKSTVMKTLHNIPVDCVDDIITSMPKRIKAVLQRDGYRTKFVCCKPWQHKDSMKPVVPGSNNNRQGRNYATNV